MSAERLLGTWQVVMRHVALEDPAIGQHRYESTLDGAFLLLRASNEHPDIPDATAFLSDSAYYYFDVRGVVRTFEFAIDEQGWELIRRDADFWQRSAVRFQGNDEMAGTGENSHDGGITWEHDYAITYTRMR